MAIARKTKLGEETKLWLQQTKEHWEDANWLLEGRRYSACLYYCHQTLEKVLKGAILERKNIIPPKGHKLEILALKSGLPLSDVWVENLAEITRHFWRVRYPDYQQAVYTNKEKIMPVFMQTKEIYVWILKNLSKKS